MQVLQLLLQVVVLMPQRHHGQLLLMLYSTLHRYVACSTARHAPATGLRMQYMLLWQLRMQKMALPETSLQNCLSPTTGMQHCSLHTLQCVHL